MECSIPVVNKVGFLVLLQQWKTHHMPMGNHGKSDREVLEGIYYRIWAVLGEEFKKAGLCSGLDAIRKWSNTDWVA